MSLTLRHTTLTNPADKAEIQENFADVKGKFDAGIGTADCSPTAGFTNSQLANSHYEMLVKMAVRASTGDVPPAGLQLVDYHPIPNLATDGSYTIDSCDYYITDIGSASSTTVSIASGTVSAGAFTVTTTHVNAQTIASGVDNNDAVGSFTVASATIPASANNRVLRMIVTLGDASILSTTGDVLVVVLKLKRTNGLRS